MNSDGGSPGHSGDGLGREEPNIEVLDEPTSTPDMEHSNHASCLSQQGTIPSDLVEMLSTLIGDASAGIDLGRLEFRTCKLRGRTFPSISDLLPGKKGHGRR
jgi:hypothetical protein